MGIALFTLDGLLAPLQLALDWITRAAQARPLTQGAVQAHAGQALRSARSALPPRQPAVRRLSAGPVRVLRVVDAHAPATAGRMVISGRMADVCAELDRLAGYPSPARCRLRSEPGVAPHRPARTGPPAA